MIPFTVKRDGEAGLYRVFAESSPDSKGRVFIAAHLATKKIFKITEEELLKEYKFIGTSLDDI